MPLTDTKRYFDKTSSGTATWVDFGLAVVDFASLATGPEEKIASVEAKGLSSVARPTVSLDANALIGAIEGNEKAAVKGAIGNAKPIVSRTAAKEFLVKGEKTALKSFMKEVGATIGNKGASTAFIDKLIENGKNLGRIVGRNDASIIGSAINNDATVITKDKKMTNYMKATNLPVKSY